MIVSLLTLLYLAAFNSPAKATLELRDTCLAALVVCVCCFELSATNYEVVVVCGVYMLELLRAQKVADSALRVAFLASFTNPAWYGCFLFWVHFVSTRGYGSNSVDFSFEKDMREKSCLVLTIGTRGDVQPFVALGVELDKLGFRVTICTTKDYRDLIETHGLHFADAGVEPLDQAYDRWQNAVHVSEVMRISLPVFATKFESVAESFLKACEANRPGLIVSTAITTTIAATMSDFFSDAQLVSVKLAPDAPTKSFDPRGRRAAVGFLNKLEWYVHWAKIISASLASKMGVVENRFRSDKLHMSKVDGISRLFDMWYRTPTLLAYSDVLVERPPDSACSHAQTGFWRIEDENDDSLPRALSFENFDVVVTHGSMLMRERTLALVEMFASESLTVLWLGAPRDFSTTSENVSIYRGFVDHSSLFKKTKIVLHHGGAGTTGTCLKAGVFQIVDPSLEWSDQPTWGELVKARGLGVLLPKDNARALVEAKKAIEMSKTAMKIVEEARREEELRVPGARVAARLISSNYVVG